MKSFLKILLSLGALGMGVFCRAENLRARASGNNLLVTTPYGSRLYLGDIGFDALSQYHIEIPLRDLRESASPPNGFGGSPSQGSSPAQTPLNAEGEDELILESNRLYNAGKFRESLAFVDELLRRNPAHARGWAMKGSLMHVLGHKDLARKAWEKARELDPNNTSVRTLLEKYP